MSEDTANAGSTAKAGGENPSREGSRTFTQEEVNSMLAKERRETEARFAGYEDFKAKAEELDQMQEASKSELQKVAEKLARAEKERDSLKAAQQRREWNDRVADATGVKASIVASLSASDEEALLEQAKAIAKEYAPPGGAPKVPEAGRFPSEGSEGDAGLRAVVHSLFSEGRGE